MDVLVPNNGAYCARLARIVKVLGRKLTTIDYSEAQQVSAADVDKALAADPSITHVALVHCETGAGVLNPLHEVAQVVADVHATAERMLGEVIPLKSLMKRAQLRRLGKAMQTAG